MTENEYMQVALELAREAANEGEVPVGCVIVHNGEIVGKGKNRRENDKNALAHAEIEAINSACEVLGDWRLDDCDMYVTLEPCPMCAGAIINARIKNLFYAVKDETSGVEYYEEIKKQLSNQKLVQIIDRIILDELVHIDTFNKLIEYITFYK